MVETVTSLIDKLGGVGKLAEAISAPLGTVSAWKTRKSIPVDYWPRIIQLAADKPLPGVNAETLLAMHAPGLHRDAPVHGAHPPEDDETEGPPPDPRFAPRRAARGVSAKAEATQ